MEKRIKTLSRLALNVCALTFLLTACGSPVPASTSVSDSQSVQATSRQNTAYQAGGSELPIVNEPVTFKVWVATPDSYEAAGIKTYNDVLTFQELEKRTGVHIEWENIPVAKATDDFNLMIASGNYTDMIIGASYQGGIDKAIQDGVYLRLNELIDQYAPNYKKLRESDDQRRKMSVTDEGNIGSFYDFRVEIEKPFLGPMVRKDWLDSLGMKTPVTLDDWHDMLKAFKEQKKADAPMYFERSGVDITLSNTFGVQVNMGSASMGTVGFLQVDGKVEYPPLEPGFKEYLTLVHQWYTEGLIDQDFFTKPAGLMPEFSLLATGESGAITGISRFLDMLKPLMEDPRAVWTAVPYPVQSAGEKVHLGMFRGKVGRQGVAITTACKDPEAAVEWLNYLYSDEGSMLMNYGVEGVTYSVVEGQPRFTELIKNNPEGLSVEEARQKYLCDTTFPKLFYPNIMYSTSESVIQSRSIFATNLDQDWVIHDNLQPTAQEGSEQSRIMGDVDAYVSRMVIKFIIGEEPISKYDEFVNTLKSMNIDRAIAIQQAALDRYNARK